MKELEQIERQIINNIESAFNHNIPENKVSLLRFISKAVAAEIYNLYLHIEKTKNEIFPQTATEEGLEKWGEILQISRTPAIPADIIVQIRNRTANPILEKGTKVRSAENIEYASERSMRFGTVERDIPVLFTCTQPGEIGNITHSSSGRFTKLEFVDEQEDFYSDLSVSLNPTIGQEQETISNFRSRIIERFYSKDLTGTVAWYKNILTSTIAQNALGFKVKQVFPYSSKLIPGLIQIYIQPYSAAEVSTGVSDNVYELTEAQKEAAVAFLDLPENALLYFAGTFQSSSGPKDKIKILSPILQEIKITIEDLSSVDTEGIKAAINEAAKQYLSTKRPFVPGIHSKDDSRINLSELIVHIDNTIKQVERDATFGKLQIGIVDGEDEVNQYKLPEGTLAVLSNDEQIYFTESA